MWPFVVGKPWRPVSAIHTSARRLGGRTGFHRAISRTTLELIVAADMCFSVLFCLALLSCSYTWLIVTTAQKMAQEFRPYDLDYEHLKCMGVFIIGGTEVERAMFAYELLKGCGSSVVYVNSMHCALDRADKHQTAADDTIERVYRGAGFHDFADDIKDGAALVLLGPSTADRFVGAMAAAEPLEGIIVVADQALCEIPQRFKQMNQNTYFCLSQAAVNEVAEHKIGDLQKWFDDGYVAVYRDHISRGAVELWKITGSEFLEYAMKRKLRIAAAKIKDTKKALAQLEHRHAQFAATLAKLESAKLGCTKKRTIEATDSDEKQEAQRSNETAKRQRMQ